MKKQPFFLALLLLGVVLLPIGCSKSNATKSIRLEMHDIYAVIKELNGYVWSEERFSSPASDARIRELLSSLQSDFHGVAKNRGAVFDEPGFQIILAVQQEMLRDVDRRFREGKKDYADWRLRSITANCISCHSRNNIKSDFVGDEPSIGHATLDEQLSRAQFLIATRQFDKASEELINGITTAGTVESGQTYINNALELWLVIEVRVKDRPAAAAKSLADLTKKVRLADETKQLVNIWINDLRFLEGNKNRPQGIGFAKELLEGLDIDTPLETEKEHLVKTLKASEILHGVLQANIAPDLRREGLLALAESYYHLPLHTFDFYRELYLEQCIREFPKTSEAKQAFALYDNYIRTQASGSSGLHLDPEQVEKLQELSNLAGLDS